MGEGNVEPAGSLIRLAADRARCLPGFPRDRVFVSTTERAWFPEVGTE
jgi:hypothetical protein